MRVRLAVKLRVVPWSMKTKESRSMTGGVPAM